jgi:hypothetical protein
MRNPSLPENTGWNYGILAVAAAFEFYRGEFRIVNCECARTRMRADEIVGSKDPTVFTGIFGISWGSSSA